MRSLSGSVRRVPEAVLALCVVAQGAVADMAYVTCQPGNALGLLDVSASREVDRWDVPGNPAGVALGAADDVFVVSTEGKMVRRLARHGGALIASVSLEGGPTGIAVDEARGRVFVTDWFNRRLFVLDAETLAPQATLQTGEAPAGVAVSDNGQFLATADKDSDQVSLYDAETLDMRHAIKVGVRPFGLAFGPDGRLYVGNVGSNDVSVIDPESGQVLGAVPVGERPYGVAFAQGRGFVTNQYADTVTVFDLGTLAVIETLDVGEYPEGIDSTADGSRIVVANWFGNSVSVIDAKELSVIDEIATCDGPRAFGRFLGGG